MAIALENYQIKAVRQMKNGCILCGGVGSGKSITALGYYYLENDGIIECLENSDYIPMNDPPLDLYIITTAKKRDTLEWEGELAPFLLSTHPESNLYSNKVIIDSWNNIKKYSDVTDAFFIFDEQRVVGSGTWVKSFLKIAKSNKWVLLSATPGDTWQDYIPVFIANGFYRNRTEFKDRHIIYDYRVKFPKIDRYINTGRLIRLRNSILVDMDFERKTVQHHENVFISYDISTYKHVVKTRINPFERGYIPCERNSQGSKLVGADILIDEVTPIFKEFFFEPKNGDYVKCVDKPIENASEFCYILRKIVNSDEQRQIKVLELFEDHPRMIIFYNFDYELEILRNLAYGVDVTIAEWNGHKHQLVPKTEKWVYLVQYNAGSEGWNCTETDTIIFYSQNYSYKMMVQASGRIDRMNTHYTDLYYYHLKSHSGIDLAISKALENKKQFNEKKFAGLGFSKKGNEER